MTRRSWRRRIYEVFAPHEGGRLGLVADTFLLLLIAANVMAVMIETIEPVYKQYAGFFEWFEIVSVAVFTIEYVARLWTAVEDETYQNAVTGRLRYATTFFMVVDLLAILPFYLAFLGLGLDLRFLRALRLLRVFRLVKMGRYSAAANAFVHVLKERKEKLVIAVTANLMLLIVASSAMYVVEHEVQPDVFPSIPETMWWGVITLTTVGYGDVVPATRAGQVVGALVAVLGIGMFALPAALIATGFAEAAGVEDAPDEA
jgi:voltage-gated potassium channel